MWLNDKEKWPKNIVQSDNPNIDAERKLMKEIIMVEVENSTVDDTLIQLLDKCSTLEKLSRVTAWIQRFVSNSKCIRSKRTKGPLTFEEMKLAEKFWIKKIQKKFSKTENFSSAGKRLKLELDNYGIFVCKGRIFGEYPIYLPSPHTFTNLVIMDAHLKTFHGLIGLTMAKVRECFWIERLRSQVKSLIRKCSFCKIYHGKPFSDTPVTSLPVFRTTGGHAFETVGVDFAGPIGYMPVKNEIKKAYIVLFTCATSRALYQDLLKEMTNDEFRRTIKEFIARRGNPTLFVSDNAKTFQSTAKWLKRIVQHPDVNEVLLKNSLSWKFNLSRSPWWGGFFERLIGLTKGVLFKSLGKAKLSFLALKEILLEVEVILNNRPFTYMEDDVELPPLTPNMIIHGKNVFLPEEIILVDNDYNDSVPPKLAKHLKKCKDSILLKWKAEYLRALRERHDSSKGKECDILEGDIVLIKGEQKNRGLWNKGVVLRLIERDGVVLGTELLTGDNRILERSVKQLYPFELKSEIIDGEDKEVSCSTERPTREEKTKAREKIKNIIEIETDPTELVFSDSLF